MTSSTPHSALTAVSPPSVSTRMRGTFTPVVVRILQSDFACARSCRASTKMRSQVGAFTRDAGEAGICFVVWPRRPRAGSTSLSTTEVKISSWAISGSSGLLWMRGSQSSGGSARPRIVP